jgi:hypothetical protein
MQFCWIPSGGTPQKPQWAATTTTQRAQKLKTNENQTQELGKHQKPMKTKHLPFPTHSHQAIKSLRRELKGMEDMGEI